MRTIINIPDAVVAALDNISQSTKVSRAEVIRRAIQQFLKNHLPATSDQSEGFGLWRDRPIASDGLAYEDQIRAEWGRDVATQ